MFLFSNLSFYFLTYFILFINIFLKIITNLLKLFIVILIFQQKFNLDKNNFINR